MLPTIPNPKMMDKITKSGVQEEEVKQIPQLLLTTLYRKGKAGNQKRIFEENAHCQYPVRSYPQSGSLSCTTFSFSCITCVFVCVRTVYQLCPTLCNPLDCIAHQAPLSTELFRQGYWSGLPFPPPGYLPDPGIESTSLVSPSLAGRFFTTVLSGKPSCVSILL